MDVCQPPAQQWPFRVHLGRVLIKSFFRPIEQIPLGLDLGASDAEVLLLVSSGSVETFSVRRRLRSHSMRAPVGSQHTVLKLKSRVSMLETDGQ